MVRVKMTSGVEKIGEVFINTGSIKLFAEGGQSELEDVSRFNSEFIMFKEKNAKQISLLNKWMISEMQVV